jgi:hypothetical protein
MKKFLLFTLCISTFIACDFGDTKMVYKESTGRINSLVIVIDNNDWKGKPGDKLRDIIAAPVIGLPQEENQFTVTQVPVKTFKSILRASRNVLLVGIDSVDSYTVRKELYASPQVVMTVLGKNEASLLKMLEKHKVDIIQVFKEADLKLYQQNLSKGLWVNDSINTLKKLGVKLNIPTKYRKVDDTGEFLWFRESVEKGSINIIGYSLPLTEDVEGNIVMARDTIGKKYIPGSVEGMHMITEAAYSPHIKKIELNGKPAFETRGKWEMKNDVMAGPFLNYTVIDKENNRLLVFEGFAFAPNADKRDYMFEVEAIIKTLKI